MGKVKDQRTFIPYDETKSEAKKIGLSAWTHWHHMPYECDWQNAYEEALKKFWRYRSE